MTFWDADPTLFQQVAEVLEQRRHEVHGRDVRHSDRAGTPEVQIERSEGTRAVRVVHAQTGVDAIVVGHHALEKAFPRVGVRALFEGVALRVGNTHHVGMSTGQAEVAARHEHVGVVRCSLGDTAAEAIHVDEGQRTVIRGAEKLVAPVGEGIRGGPNFAGRTVGKSRDFVGIHMIGFHRRNDLFIKHVRIPCLLLPQN